MQAKLLQTEMVIDINNQKDLDEISNIKLDLLLCEIPSRERHTKIEPETKPVKLVVRSIAVTQPKKAENKPDTKPKSKPVNKVETKPSPESKPGCKAETKLKSKPPSTPSNPEKPMVSIKVNSIIAKAKAKDFNSF